MAASTPKQRTQGNLAWKLRMVKGAQGTLCPREGFSPRLTQDLLKVCSDLKFIEDLIRYELANIK